MIRACGADDVALSLPRRKFKKRRFQMIDDIATDLEGDNVRVATMYIPDPQQWDDAGRFRRPVT